ncbi:right-handed parallel beta-helix repeat-containing protein [Nostoc sp. PA-18-2419]|uniref:right-handed parallel beta-helix repeat-containing protein n=1 Tax=Nostoc sp. PA-18-2419 TaxID=2575443 RepID=UPI001CB92E6D|nr:right-handed parallel beta-helix repeat-containing protein [Nostoc sp. PA-18-2419]
MMIHGLSFLSLSASAVLPWALTGMLQGQKIRESVVTDVPQSSTVQEKKLPNRNLISATTAATTTYYVSGSGKDTNSGLTASSPFRTPQRAANLTQPGDTVLLMNGVYTNSNPNGSGIDITRSGSANAWIVYKAYPGHSPKIQFNGWHGIWIKDGASYIEVNDLEIEGNNRNISLSYALSQKKNTNNPLTSGSCITVDGRTKSHPHHVRILNSKLHDCGAGGISAIETDYLTVDGNEVFNNAWYSPFGGSGISMLRNWNYGNDNSQKYRNIITRNKVYRNQMYVPWIFNGKIQDGNGIIFDRLRESGYQGSSLVANNVVYLNGGGGIHSFRSDKLDIIHNTSYLNNQSPGIPYGNVSLNDVRNANVLNNILYSRSGAPINVDSSKNTNTTFNYNLYNDNGYDASGSGPNDIIADPQFINASGGDFRLKSTSRAINSGSRFSYLTTDILGNPRVRGSGPDRGAYEMQ